MGRKFYRFISPIIRLCIPKLEVQWDVPWDEAPCVFVANHERAMGPLQMAINFPLRDRSKIWIFADALSRETVPAWVRQDHWWKEDGFFAPLWNALIPPIVALILPPILRSVPHVPVYHDARAVRTMKDSLRAMRDEGMNIVIFPEIPTGYGEHDTEHINEGFLHLLPMYHRMTGRTLPIWVVHLDTAAHSMAVHTPILWDPARPIEEQTPELAQTILHHLFHDPEGGEAREA